jgi:hypothetical protein
MEIYLRHRRQAHGESGGPNGVVYVRSIEIGHNDLARLCNELHIDQVAKWRGGVHNGEIASPYRRTGTLQQGATYNIANFYKGEEGFNEFLHKLTPDSRVIIPD